MLRHHIKLTLRNLWKNRSFSAINISGFAIGIAAATMLLMYTWDELSYDNFHAKKDDIYLVGVKQQGKDGETESGWTTPPTGPALNGYFPEIETFTRVCIWFDDVTTRRGQEKYIEKNVVGADSTFFDVFTVNFLAGNPQTALKEPNSVVITKSIAEKYFGNENPIGKTMEFESFFSECTITGLIEDLPENSHLEIDILFSLSSLRNINFDFDKSWENHTFITYVLLNEFVDPQVVESKIPDFLSEKMGAYFQNSYGQSFEEMMNGGSDYRLFLAPLKDVHLSTYVHEGKEGKKLMTYALGLIGLVIIILICINFTNLSTSLAIDRIREVGVRKTSGSLKWSMIRQFLTESVVTVLIGFVIGLAIMQLVLPYFNNLTDKNLSLDFFHLPFVLWVLGIAVLLGIITGLYPAIYLSSFSPIQALNPNPGERLNTTFVRNGLVVFQFALCIFMITGTIVVYKQLSHLTQINIGFDKEHILVVKRPWALGEKMWTLKEELLDDPQIKYISYTNTLPGRHFDGHGQHFSGDPTDVGYTIYPLIGDPDILKLLDLEVVAGREFTAEDKNKPVVLLNEATVQRYGLKDPLNKKINVGTMGRKEVSVVGIVKDFHFQSFHNQIEPMAIFQTNQDQMYNTNYMLIKTTGKELSGIIENVESRWNKITENQPFEYTFLDQDFAHVFEREVITSKVYTIFSTISIMIASLGLLGLAMFFTKKRTKEIGIRKVNGAKIWQVLLLLNNDFIKRVLIAFTIASPLAWYTMNKWLENFAYQTELSWWIFALSGLLALGIALLSVSWQSWKAATRNPVEALRYE